MPKSHRKKTRRGGGIWDDLKNKTNSWTSGFNTSSWTSGISNWNPFATTTSPTTTSSSPTTSYETSSSPTTSYETSSSPTTYNTTTPNYGGKKKRSIKRGGSYSANMSQTNLAASASPVSGIQTVKAQTWVGGKTKRRRHKHNKSRKHLKK